MQEEKEKEKMTKAELLAALRLSEKNLEHEEQRFKDALVTLTEVNEDRRRLRRERDDATILKHAEAKRFALCAKALKTLTELLP